MPIKPMQDARGRCGCPVCGSLDTQDASTAAEDRIRNAIAAHWAAPPGARGPDGKWLRGSVIAWAGAWAFTAVTTTSPGLVAPWEWTTLLLIALLLGVWADRLAARRRGWIDPLQRANDIVRQARERDAASADATPAVNPVTGAVRGAGHELLCLRCGHRFEPEHTPASVAIA